jgi:hypothetical protein
MTRMEESAINFTILDFLCAAPAAAVLKDLEKRDLGDEQTLAVLSELRRDFRPEEAAALLSLARLRRRAEAKFPNAQRLFFTREALEQASAAAVAEHHAIWLDRHAPPGPILDLGCGIGGDTLALAQRRPVIAYEIDPVRLRLARANAEACGLAQRIDFRLADWTADLRDGSLPDAAGAFADPARRVDGRRRYRLDQIQPPIRDLLALQARIPILGAKVMPGIDDREIPPTCGVEFVGHEGSCKEAVLWFDRAATYRRWASIYEDGGWYTRPSLGKPPPIGPLSPGMTLHEPHPALIRAGALAELCDELDAHLFDAQIAYLMAERRGTHPLVQSFFVEQIAPYSLKTLNRILKQENIGQVELKKRGFPVEPESLRPRLRLQPGGRTATILFTRRGNERLMLIGHRGAPEV